MSEVRRKNEIIGMDKIRSKKGSSAVFLTVILAALISIVLALIYSVKAETEKSSVDAIINLAGDSVMSEFDRKLQKEYGLFLLKGTDDELSGKLLAYVNYSLDDMNEMEVDLAEVTSAGYSTINISMIKEQISEHMKIKEAEGMVDDLLENDETAQPPGSNNMEDRYLKHGPTIASLPSAVIPKKNLSALAESLANKAKDVEAAFESGSESFLVNKYIFDTFNSSSHISDKNHFFRNEVEYILAGEMTDKKNAKRVEMALKAMRFPINMAHLYADSKKQAALAAAAQALTPGAAAVATQAALASTWAYAESDNDVELLLSGHKVPMVKDSSTWAIDLDSAIEGIFVGIVLPAKEKGYTYNEYLHILLFFQDENVKMARILDLIQINMRAGYDKDFLISEYAAGISVRVKINGRTYFHEKKY